MRLDFCAALLCDQFTDVLKIVLIQQTWSRSCSTPKLVEIINSRCRLVEDLLQFLVGDAEGFETKKLAENERLKYPDRERRKIGIGVVRERSQH